MSEQSDPEKRPPNLPATIWRESYLYKLRYFLRGNDALLVEEYVRTIGEHIEDAVAERKSAATLGADRAELSDDEVERAVVKALVPPDKMARMFRRAFAQRELSDRDSLLADVIMVVLAGFLATSAGIGCLPIWGVHTIGLVAFVGALLSAIVRRLPVGPLTHFVHEAMRWIRWGMVGGAMASGSGGLTGVIIATIGAHGITFAAHFEHMPASVLAIVLSVMLASQPRLLRKHESRLRRYVDINTYRGDLDAARIEAERSLRPEWWHDPTEEERTVGYFTEPRW